jgi:itaconyl-CoA hydratase
MAEERVETDWQGRFYEDFAPGTTYLHGVGRTVEDTDNTWFTLLTNNSNEIHFNADYAESGLFGKRLVNSCLTLAIVTGLSVAGVSRNAAANLGWDEVRLPAPVFAGDTLYARSRCLEKRLSSSRPGLGIVRVETEGYNQRDEVVITFKRNILVKCRERPGEG